jgi:HD-GYP domain-containing protein (c-di-GMP phosphodiesterase class II)
MGERQQARVSAPWEEMLFRAFHRLVQACRIHQDNNELVKVCLAQFVEIMGRVNRNEELPIVISEGRFYVRGENLHQRKSTAQLIHDMLNFFQGRELGGLSFLPSITRVPIEDVLAFVRLLIRSREQKQPAVWLAESVETAHFSWVRVLPGSDRPPSLCDPERRAKARATYVHALATVKEVAQKIGLQGHAGVRTAKHIVQNMVDSLLEDESLFLVLSTIKDYDDYTYTHSVNVAVLSLCLGNRIGLSRPGLEQIGLCGLFHDLGKVEVPLSILRKPGQLTEGEWQEMRKHPLISVKHILKLQAPHDLKSRLLLGPFEHHVTYDLRGGYPVGFFKRSVSLFGRILKITDVYDAITSPRVYRPTACSPDQALTIMLKGAATEFDPLLLKVFVTMMGTYPLGTLLEFDTGEIGLVVRYSKGTGSPYPEVLLLERDDVGFLRAGEMVDLDPRDPSRGVSFRRVVRSLNPGAYGIQPADFLLPKDQGSH